MKNLRTSIALLLFVLAGARAQNPIVLVGATLIDGSGGPPVPNSAVMIEGSKITHVGLSESMIINGQLARKIRTPQGMIDIPESAGVYDVSGKTLMPGLIDAHIHYDGVKRDLVQMLAWGVTSVNCMVEETDRARALEKETAPDTVASPQFYATAPIFTAKHGWWWGKDFPDDSSLNRFPSTPAEARAQVRRAKAKGIKRIKLMYDDMRWCRDTLAPLVRMNKNVMAALLDEAGRDGLVAEVHAPQMKDAREVLASGFSKKRKTAAQDTSAHIEEIGSFGFAHGILDDTLSDGFVKSMLSKHAFYIPTFCVFEFLANTPKFIGLATGDSRLQAALPESVYYKYNSQAYFDHYRKTYPNTAFVNSHLPILRRNAKVLLAHHVPVVLGTDMWAIPGYGVHLELEYMVQAGFTPMEAIVSATKMGARFLGRESTLGTIEAGKQADILILNAIPTQYVPNTRSVWKIIKQGMMYDHQELIDESRK